MHLPSFLPKLWIWSDGMKEAQDWPWGALGSSANTPLREAQLPHLGDEEAPSLHGQHVLWSSIPDVGRRRGGIQVGFLGGIAGTMWGEDTLGGGHHWVLGWTWWAQISECVTSSGHIKAEKSGKPQSPLAHGTRDQIHIYVLTVLNDSMLWFLKSAGYVYITQGTEQGEK